MLKQLIDGRMGVISISFLPVGLILYLPEEDKQRAQGMGVFYPRRGTLKKRSRSLKGIEGCALQKLGQLLERL